MARRRYRHSRYRRKYRHRSDKLSKDEEFQLLIAGIIFVVLFVFYLLFNFISNCIFEWPPRWDIGTCWNEQVTPAKEKAAEKAAPFVP